MAPALTVPLLILAALATAVFCAAGLSPRTRIALFAVALVAATVTGFAFSAAALS